MIFFLLYSGQVGLGRHRVRFFNSSFAEMKTVDLSDFSEGLLKNGFLKNKNGNSKIRPCDDLPLRVLYDLKTGLTY